MFCFSSLGGCHIPVKTINVGPFISCLIKLWCGYRYVYVHNTNFSFLYFTVILLASSPHLFSRTFLSWWQLFSLCLLTVSCLSTFSCNNCFQGIKQKCGIALFNIFQIKYTIAQPSVKIHFSFHQILPRLFWGLIIPSCGCAPIANVILLGKDQVIFMFWLR